VGDEELVRRISGRRTCSLCNKVFNVYTAPPSSPATDCVPGSNEHQLFQRKDDEEATVTERLRVYEDKTRPVLSYYSDSGLLRTVRAEGTLEQITERLLQALAEAVAPAPAAPVKKRARKTARKRPAKRRAASPGSGARAARVRRKKSVARRVAAPKKKRAAARRPARVTKRRTARKARPARARRGK
jgi:hypothetical protein